MKSFRSAGRLQAFRALIKYSGDPWNDGVSVKTDKQVAPPCSYACANSGGLKSGLINPFDGLAFLISAINPYPDFVAFFKESAKKRTESASSAISSRSLIGSANFAFFTSSSLYSFIFSNMSVILICP